MAHIQLLINANRKELLRDGWGTAKTAKAFIPAEFIAITDEEDPLYPGFHSEGVLREWIAIEDEEDPRFPGYFVDNAVFEADTGVLRLKPNFQKDDFLWDVTHNDAFLESADFVFGDAADWEEVSGEDDGQPNQMKFLHTMRDVSVGSSSNGVLTSLGSLTADLQDLVDATFGEMIPALRTANPLAPNEGFGVILWNSGVSDEREEFYRWGVLFGGRFLLAQHMSGKWTLSRNWGSQAAPDWQVVQEYWPNQWSAKMQRPVHIGIVPMKLPNRIAFYISDAPQPSDRTTKYGGTVGPAFIYETKGDDENIITSTGNVWMFLQKGEFVDPNLLKGTHYAIAMHRVRYSAATVRLMPECLPRPLPSRTPELTIYGKDLGGGNITKNFISDTGAVWVPATDKRLVVEIGINPFGGNIYSPVVIGYEIYIAQTSYTPAATPIDLTGEWFSLSFTLSSEPAGSSLSASLRRFDDYDKLFKLDSSVRLLVDGVAVWDGYIERVTNTIEGTTGPLMGGTPAHGVWMNTDLDAFDMWERLERTRLARYVPVHSLTLQYLPSPNLWDGLADVINRAGMDAHLPTGAEEIEDILLDPWQGIDQMPAPIEDSSAADCVRDFYNLCGMQNRAPITAQWDPVNSRMEVSLGPRYAVDPQNPTEGELPTVLICLEEDIIEEIEGQVLTDAERWDTLADRQYLMARGNPEFPIVRGEYNALSAFSSSSADQKARGYAVHIDPDPASLQDDTHIDYQAGVRTLTLPPNETAHAPTPIALEKLARHRYDRDCTTERHCYVPAEWQAWVSPRMARPFVAVLGRNAAGEIVSYGAYRIVQIGVDLQADYDAAEQVGAGGVADRAFLWVGDYLLEYVGIADYVIGDVSIAMFSDVLPELS